MSDVPDIPISGYPFSRFLELGFDLKNKIRDRGFLFWITGFPEYASPLIDRFYPLSYPFYLVTHDIFVMNFVILLHLFIAYLAFYKLGSISIRNPDLLMIFSLFYVFSGTMIMRIVGGAIFYVFAFAWLPLVYYFFFKIVSSERKNIWDYVFFIISFLLYI